MLPLVDVKLGHTQKFITVMFLAMALMSTFDQEPNDLFAGHAFPVHLALSTKMEKYQRKRKFKENFICKIFFILPC